jgi:DNA-directed RNA polymerase specialized sigma24 family protein
MVNARQPGMNWAEVYRGRRAGDEVACLDVFNYAYRLAVGPRLKLSREAALDVARAACLRLTRSIENVKAAAFGVYLYRTVCHEAQRWMGPRND